MERYQLALTYHAQGFNCAQSVVTAFCDVTGLGKAESLALAGGFGKGVGGGQEICGAASGAIMVLGLCNPHTAVKDKAAKERIYGLSVEFQRRFRQRFGALRCDPLLHAAYPITPELKAATAMGYTAPACNVLIVTAVELAEEMLAEEGMAVRQG